MINILILLVYDDCFGKKLFESGANATLTGDMLTTVRNNTSEDRQMLKELGYTLKERNLINE